MALKNYLFILMICASFSFACGSQSKSKVSVENQAKAWFDKHSKQLKISLTKYSLHFDAMQLILYNKIEIYKNLQKKYKNASEAKKADDKRSELVSQVNSLYEAITMKMSQLQEVADELFAIELLMLVKQDLNGLIELYKTAYDLVDDIKQDHEKKYGPVKIVSKL